MGILGVSGEPIRVGIVGLGESGSWAERSHLPALRAVDGYEVVALSASSAESAVRSGAKHDVPLTFGTAHELASCDDVDLVVVSVKVPKHHELVSAVLAAGKSVLCEWPLGNGLAEAEDLADRARRADVTAVVGLQARSSPAVRYLADLVQDGYVGEVLSTSVLGSGRAWGRQVPSAGTHYLLDRANGATMLSIPLGHTLDGMAFVLGRFAALDATMVTRARLVDDLESGQKIEMTAADQISVTGNFGEDIFASVHYRGGTSRGTNFQWEINGSEGDIIVTADSGHLQYESVTIRGVRGSAEMSELAIPASYRGVTTLDPVTDTTAYAVAHAYRQLRSDVVEGTTLVPTFDHAVVRHRDLERISELASSKYADVSVI